MRILEVSEHYFPHVGGISEHVFFLSRELCRLGHEVEILTSRVPGIPPDEVKVIQIGRGVRIPINKGFTRMTLGLDVGQRISRLLRNRQYEVVHIHGSLAPTLPMAVLERKKSIPHTAAVATFHAGHGPSTLYRVFKNPMRKRHFSFYNGLIAVSPIARDTMAYFFPADYRIIPNGVDTEIFSRGKSSLEGILPSSSLKLLFTGRFEPKKGLRHLLTAMPLIKKRVPDVKLVVVGKGMMRPYYSRFIADDVRDSITFAGQILGSQRREFYRWCDISVTPSIGAESFGITLLEAMGCGKPVVASDIPAFRNVLSEDEGVFTRPCDPDDLARGILELHDRRRDWPRIAVSGRRKAQNHSWTKIAGMVEEYFLEIRGRLGSRKK